MTSSVPHKFGKFFKLPYKTIIILSKAAYISIKAEFQGKQALYKKLEYLQARHSISYQRAQINSALPEIKDLVLCMALLEKHAPWKPKCYNRALTAIKVLNSYGIKPKLHIGFRKKDTELDGHAWVTIGNIFITGFRDDLASYSILK